MFERLGIAEHLGHEVEVGRGEAAPVHLREMLEELGPTFVKLGQLLSTRPDIVPEPYISELVKLQDTAPTLPVSEVHRVIQSEFDAPVRDLYLEFDETPLAAASLAQVHRARLLDGTPVIVKVQRPGIRDQVETDIEILYKRAKFLEGHWERARTYGVMDIVDEFATTIREELDYTREARNTDLLRDQIAHLPGIDVPAVYWNLTTSKVLTLEQMMGIKVTDLPRHPFPGVDPKDIAQRLASAFMDQVFVAGFFHADPHPGNILVSQDGDIQLVDIGQVGRLDPESRTGAIRMLVAFEQQDMRALADDVLNLGIIYEEVDVRRFTQDLGKVLRAYYNLPARSVNMGRLLTMVLDVSSNHKIRLPVVFTVLGKVFTNVEGICRQLDPDFNFTAVARGYVGKAVRRELTTEGLLDEFLQALASTKTFLFQLPEQLDRLTRKAVEGTFRLEFKHMGLEELSDNFRAAANRIAIALIVGALIVGSSLIVLAGPGPTSWFALPLLGVIGYLIATVFGVWLIISIIRSGRHKP